MRFSEIKDEGIFVYQYHIFQKINDHTAIALGYSGSNGMNSDDEVQPLMEYLSNPDKVFIVRDGGKIEVFDSIEDKSLLVSEHKNIEYWHYLFMKRKEK